MNKSIYLWGAETFNRTAYGIEIMEQLLAFAAWLLLIAPLMELKWLKYRHYRICQRLLIAPLMELKYDWMVDYLF